MSTYFTHVVTVDVVVLEATVVVIELQKKLLAVIADDQRVAYMTGTLIGGTTIPSLHGSRVSRSLAT